MGRTPGFGPGDSGSSPGLPANKESHPFGVGTACASARSGSPDAPAEGAGAHAARTSELPTLRQRVSLDGETYYSERLLVEALADLYAHDRVAVALLCDKYLSKSGYLLGVVRDAVIDRTHDRETISGG